MADDSLEVPGGGHPGHPADHDQFENLVLNYANAAYLYGSGLSALGRIDGGGNPFGPDEDYLTSLHRFFRAREKRFR